MKKINPNATSQTGLTEKELSCISDQLSQETVLVQKFKQYAQQCEDPELKTKCEQIASKHQEHFNTLFQILN